MIIDNHVSFYVSIQIQTNQIKYCHSVKKFLFSVCLFLFMSKKTSQSIIIECIGIWNKNKISNKDVIYDIAISIKFNIYLWLYKYIEFIRERRRIETECRLHKSIEVSRIVSWHEDVVRHTELDYVITVSFLYWNIIGFFGTIFRWIRKDDKLWVIKWFSG